MLGLQFENLVLNNRPLILEALNIHPEAIIADDPYFQRPTRQQKGCQIDYLIQTKTNTLFVCEIKFSSSLSTTEIITQMKEKMARLSLPRGFSALPVLIYFQGLEENTAMQDYFHQIIRLDKYL